MMLLAINTYGPGLTADSIIYLSTAKNIATHFAFVKYDGEALTNWAPLYPLLLSVGYMLQLPIFGYALFLNFCAIVVSIVVCYCIVRPYIHAKYFIAFLLIISFSYYKLLITLYSEAIFSCFQALFLFYFIKYIYSNKNKHLNLAAAFMALMCLQRYAGFMMFLVVLLILFTDKNIRLKIKPILVFILIAIVPSLPWLIKNYFIAGGFTGQHTLSGKLNPNNLGLNLYHILVYLQAHYALLFIYGTALFLWIATILFYKKNTTNAADKEAAKALWFYCSAYFFLLLLQNKLHLFELARYLSVLYIPLLCYAAMFLHTWYKKYEADKNSILVINILLAAISVFQTVAILYHIKNTKEIGVGGFATISWHNKDLLSYINKHLSNKNVTSNYPDFLWLINQKQYQFTQYKGETNTAFMQRYNGQEYLFWIKHPMRQTLIEPTDSSIAIKYNVLLDRPNFTLYEIKK